MPLGCRIEELVSADELAPEMPDVQNKSPGNRRADAVRPHVAEDHRPIDSSKLGMHKKKPRTKRGLWYQASIGVNHAHQPYMDLRRHWLR
jgi:hypothetical protein